METTRFAARWAARRGAATIQRTAVIRLILALLTILTTSTCEAGCHIYRVWHYKAPQRCFTALAPGRSIQRLINLEQTPPNQERLRNTIDLIPSQPHAPPWPTLEGIDWGHVGDERMEGIAKLRALSNGP